MNYGLTADDAIDKMMMLGDISQGSADKMNRIAMAYGQMSSAGKVQLEDIKQMIEAGFNPLQEISQSTGESMASLYDRISKGTIAVDEITASMIRSTSAGGKYFQSMEKQSKTVSGQLSTLKDNAQQLIGTLSEGFSQQLAQNVLPTLNEMIAGLQEAFETGGIEAFSSKLGEVLSDITTKISETLPKILELGVQIIQNLILGLQQNSQGISANIIKVLSTVITGILEILPMLLELGIQSIAYLAKGIAQEAPNLLKTIAETLTSLVETIVDNIDLVVDAGIELATALIEGFSEAIPLIIDELPTLIEKIVSALIKNLPKLSSAGMALNNALLEGLIQIIPEINNAIPEIIKAIGQAFKEADWEEIYNSFYDVLYSSIISLLGTLWTVIKENLNLEEYWNSIVSFFTTGIPNFINSVINWFKDLPRNIGYLLGQLLGKIVEFGMNAWNWVTTELPKIIEGIINWFKELPSKIYNWLLETIKKIYDWGVGINKWVATELPKLINDIINWFKELPNKIVEVGKNLITGLWNGIVGAKNWLEDKIKGFADGVVDGFKDTLGIHSPSRVMAYWGKFIPQGLAVGIEADTDSAIKAIDEMNNEIERKMRGAVYTEMGKINANATVKANNSMFNVTTINSTIQGTVELEGKTTGRLLAPFITQTYRKAGAN